MKRQDINRRPMPEAVIESLEPEALTYREKHANGVYLRVQPNGAKDWQLRFQHEDGSWSWLALGRYGRGAHELTGQFARQQAIELLEEAKSSGVSLIASGWAAEEDAGPQETFAQLASDWLSLQRASKAWTDVAYQRAEAVIEHHILPVMGSRAYASIPASDWSGLFKNIAQQAALDTLTQARDYCRDMYALAQVHEPAQCNPIDAHAPCLAPSKRAPSACVSSDELPALIRALRGYPVRPMAIGLQLLLLLAVRPSELREAQWSQFDLKAGLWSRPVVRNKQQRDWLLPLPEQAIALLHELQTYRDKGPFLFPGRMKSLDKPIGSMAFNHALDRLGYKGRQTPNGMRALLSAAAQEAGKDDRVLDGTPARKAKGVDFNAAQYVAERRALLQWWADTLDAMAGSAGATP